MCADTNEEERLVFTCFCNMKQPTAHSETFKTLLIIRHAKSSWQSDTLDDFDRPLNERGKNDAPIMAERLKEKNIFIDAFVSSPAKRARKTATAFAEIYQHKKEDIVMVSKLYHASPETLYEVVKSLNDAWNCVALFSHNPGITDFVNQLTETLQIDNMPTCGIFGVRIPNVSWKDFREVHKEFLLFYYPKLP